jgi:hypothetical protein
LNKETETSANPENTAISDVTLCTEPPLTYNSVTSEVITGVTTKNIFL